MFTDIFEKGGGIEAFHGGFGLMNKHGMKKSTYQAYRFLHQLDSEVIAFLYNYAKTLKEAVRAAKRVQRRGRPENLTRVQVAVIKACTPRKAYLQADEEAA